MYTNKKNTSVPCVPGAFAGGLSRTNFFDGMFLTEKELDREQYYNRMKRRLTNRALGEGIVWGLRLQWDSHKHIFYLAPGYALDCCGNDLIIECAQALSEAQVVDKSDPLVQAILAGDIQSHGHCPDPDQQQAPRKAAVILKYCEVPETPLPIHQDACSSNVTRCEFSSVRETALLKLAPIPEPCKTSPVDEFCHAVQELREQCKEMGPDCGLFFSDNDLLEKELHVVTRLVDAKAIGGFDEGIDLRPPYEAGTKVGGTLGKGADGNSEITGWVKPDSGYVFVGGTIINKDTEEQHSVQPFGNEIKFSLGGDQLNQALVVQDLVIAPLFGGGEVQTASYVIHATSDPGQWLVKVVVETTDVDRSRLQAKACGDWLSAKLFTLEGNPACVGKTFVLAMLHGWLRTSLPEKNLQEVGAGGPAYKVPTKNASERYNLLAWFMCQVVWKLLFKADISDQQGEKLTALTQKLFQDWCHGFVYPGPCCHDDEHGVYLGCVELSDKGGVISFDPWALRRHVITGPLLSHWAGQFGLAPIDVVAGRFAQWVCCVKSLPAITRPLEGVFGNAKPMEAVAVNEGGTELYLGDNVEGYLSQAGYQMVGEKRAVSTEELNAELFKSISQIPLNRYTRDMRGREVVTIPGQNVALLIPVDAPVLGRRDYKEFSEAVKHASYSARPFARNAVADFLRTLSDDVNLVSLDVPEGNEKFELVVESLTATGITSLRDYLMVGPEEGAELARVIAGDKAQPLEEFYIAAEQVFNASEGFVEKAAKPILKNISDSEEMFVRENLANEKLIAAVRSSATTSLKKNRLTTAMVTDVAAKVVAMGPGKVE